MAYKGGYYVKPVDVDFDGLVNQYTQGKAKAEASREVRRQDRAQQLKDLTEASTFEHTGIEDIDQAYMQAGQIAAQAIQDAHRANIAGEGTLAYANGEFSHQMSQVGVLGKQVDLMKARIEETDKRIADGEASIAEKNQLLASWYPRKGMLGTIKLGDGTEREALKSFSFGHRKNKNGFNDLVVNVTQEFQDEDGNVQVFRGQRGLTDALSPNREMVNRVTVIDKAKDINKVFGDREFYVDPVTGLSIPSPLYQKNMSLPSGDVLFARGVAPETFGDVRNTVETNIKGTSRLEYISMLAELGARSPIDADFNGYRDVSVVNNMYAGMYDENGNPIQFESDPLVLGVDGSMNYFLTEDNKKFIDAMLRDNIYKGMDVTAEELRDNKIRAKGGSGSTTNYTMSTLPMKTFSGGPSGRSTQSMVAGAALAPQYFRDMVTAEYQISAALKSNSTPSNIRDINDFYLRGYDVSSGGLFTANVATLPGMASVNKTFAGQDINNSTIVGATMTNFKKLYPQTKPTTLNGYEMTEVNGMIAVDTDNGLSIHFLGETDMADMKRVLAAGGGNAASSGSAQLTGLSVTRVPGVSKPLSDQEMVSTWVKRYDNDTDFKAKADAIAKTYGYADGRDPQVHQSGTATIGPADWWYQILEMYK